MTTNVNVNFKKNELIISATFAKKASAYNSPEYKELMDAQKNHPTFKLIVKAPIKRKTSPSKGVNYEYMRKYIENHDTSKELLKEFDKLREEKTPFHEVKDWFLDQYSELKNCKTKADWVLAA
jgi:hypothetical protein